MKSFFQSFALLILVSTTAFAGDFIGFIPGDDSKEIAEELKSANVKVAEVLQGEVYFPKNAIFQIRIDHELAFLITAQGRYAAVLNQEYAQILRMAVFASARYEGNDKKEIAKSAFALKGLVPCKALVRLGE